MIDRFVSKLRPLLRTPQFTLSVGILLVLLILVVFAPQLSQWDPAKVDGSKRFDGPSATHWLGCDEFGRDIFSNLAFGARMSLLVSLSSMTLSCLVGTVLGLIAGYSRGIVEAVMMRGVDILLSFPPILMAIFLVSLTGPSIENLILVIAILYMPRFTRIAYSSTLAIRDSMFVESARVIGTPTWSILIRHILPNILAPLFVQFSLGLGAAILMESGLSFLGLGPPPPAPSWGRMISKARRFLALSPYGVLWPSLIISMTVLAFNLMGDALRDRLDPRLRGKLGDKGEG